MEDGQSGGGNVSGIYASPLAFRLQNEPVFSQEWRPESHIDGSEQSALSLKAREGGEI